MSGTRRGFLAADLAGGVFFVDWTGVKSYLALSVKAFFQPETNRKTGIYGSMHVC